MAAAAAAAGFPGQHAAPGQIDLTGVQIVSASGKYEGNRAPEIEEPLPCETSEEHQLRQYSMLPAFNGGYGGEEYNISEQDLLQMGVDALVSRMIVFKDDGDAMRFDDNLAEIWAEIAEESLAERHARIEALFGAGHINEDAAAYMVDKCPIYKPAVGKPQPVFPKAAAAPSTFKQRGGQRIVEKHAAFKPLLSVLKRVRLGD